MLHVAAVNNDVQIDNHVITSQRIPLALRRLTIAVASASYLSSQPMLSLLDHC